MRFTIPAASLLIWLAFPAESQPLPAVPQAASPTYADLADLALDAPIVAHVRVDRASRLSDKEAPNVGPGRHRFLMEGTIVALIRGRNNLPAKVTWLADLPDQSNGRPARVARRSEQLLLATAVPGRPGELRLAAPDSLLPYAPSTADRLRAILREATEAGAAPAITGVGRAFHVPGNLPGESETQIFLLAADNRPISLSILRRPGEMPRWSVALGEIVDNAASAPARDSLLWYRLACFLPVSLPRASIGDASAQEAEAIRGDYAFVRQSLGPCTRSRGR